MRPLVSALLVLPREVRPASDKQHVQASAKGKTRQSRYTARHRSSPAIDKAGDQGLIALEPAKSSVTPRGRIKCKTSRPSHASLVEPLLWDRYLRDQDHRPVRRDRAEARRGGCWLADGPWQSVGMLIEHRGRTLQVDPSACVAPTAVVCGDMPG